MIPNAKYYEQVRKIVAGIIADYELEYPLDAYGLAKRIGFKITNYTSLDSVYKISEDGFSFENGGAWYMYINNERGSLRMNFTIAHELGHFLLHNMFKKNNIETPDLIEMLCNFFANYLLAPTPLVKERLKVVNAENISTEFRVSQECAENVLRYYENRLKISKEFDYEEEILSSQIKPTFELSDVTKRGWLKGEYTFGIPFTPGSNFPIVNPYMVPLDPPKKIIPFSKAMSVRSKIDEYFISFYCEDNVIDKVKNNPKQYLNLFNQADGILGFDYSVSDDMPMPEQIHQMFLNQALSCYYGSTGVAVIPNIRYGRDEIMGDYFDAIPRNTLVSIGTHGQVKGKGGVSQNEKDKEWVKCLDLILEKLDPTGIVVYGPLPPRIFKRYEQKGVKFFQFDPISCPRNDGVVVRNNKPQGKGMLGDLE